MTTPAERSLTTKVKVHVIAPARPIIGGQTVQAERLVQFLRNEAEVSVTFQPINPRFLPALQRIKFVRTLVTTLKYVFDLLREVPRCDIVHVFSASYFSFLLAPTPAILVAKLYKKKAILHYHSGEASDHLNRWHRSAIPTIKLFDEVIMPSDYLVSVFAEHDLPAASIFNIIETAGFPFRARSPLRPVFLINRSFEEHYNIPCSLRSFREIQQQIPDAQLIVAGDGPLNQQVRRLATELQLTHVEFLGRLAPEKMVEVYDRADVYLNSPNIDNMPNSIIEAFACGLPVVSTNAGGIPYIVDNERTGLLVEVGDHKALATAALRLFNEPGLAESLMNAARAEIEKYSWRYVRDAWLSLYCRLSNNGRPNLD